MNQHSLGYAEIYGKDVDVELDHVWPRVPTTSPLRPAVTVSTVIDDTATCFEQVAS
jgi:hypothetical protein